MSTRSLLAPALVAAMVAPLAGGCGKTEPPPPSPGAAPAVDAAPAPHHGPDAAVTAQVADAGRATTAPDADAQPAPTAVTGPFVGVWKIDFDAMARDPKIKALPAGQRTLTLNTMKKAETRIAFGADGQWSMRMAGGLRRGGYSAEEMNPTTFKLLTASVEGETGVWRAEVDGDQMALRRDGADALPLRRAPDDERPAFSQMRPGLTPFLFGRGVVVPEPPADLHPLVKEARDTAERALVGVWTRDLEAMVQDPALAGLPASVRRGRIDKARLLFAALRIAFHPDGKVELTFGRMQQQGTWTPIELKGTRLSVVVAMTLAGATARELLTIDLAAGKLHLRGPGDATVTLARKMRVADEHGGAGHDDHEAPNEPGH